MRWTTPWLFPWKSNMPPFFWVRLGTPSFTIFYSRGKHHHPKGSAPFKKCWRADFQVFIFLVGKIGIPMQILGPGPCVRLLFLLFVGNIRSTEKGQRSPVISHSRQNFQKKSSKITGTILGASSQDSVQWLTSMVIVRPQDLGLFPFQGAFLWLINGRTYWDVHGT